MTALDLARALGTALFMALVVFIGMGMSIWMPWLAGWLQ